MSISWTTPAALWLLAVVPAVWMLLRFSRTNFNPRQRLIQAAARSFVLVALTLALARPVVSMSSSRLSVVYLVDVSQSIASQSIVAAADRIDALAKSLRPDHSRVLAFGATVAVLADSAALRALASADPADPAGPVRREGTDLEQALRRARAELLPGHVPRSCCSATGTRRPGRRVTPPLRWRRPASAFSRSRWRHVISATPDRPHRRAGSPVGRHAGDGLSVTLQPAGRLPWSNCALAIGSSQARPQTWHRVTSVPMDVTFAEAGAQRLRRPWP
jgi:hypothetical protein